MHSPSTFHLKAPLYIFKATIISLLLFLPQNQLFYPVTLFIALILFISIILKVNLTQIYLLKSHSLYLALKRFHKHSRSSFKEIVLFAWNFKENLQLACITFLFSFIKDKYSNQCTSYWILKMQSNIPRKSCFPWFLFTFFNQFLLSIFWLKVS